MKNIYKLLIAIAGATALLTLEITYRRFTFDTETMGMTLVRSFGLTGATLIALSFASSVVFKIWPRLGKHWRFRRYTGAIGGLYATLHVFQVDTYMYNLDFGTMFYTLNPIENPLVIGAAAYPIILLMTLTSTDWAVQKLRRNWKRLHRLIYLAFPLILIHYLLIHKANTLPGMIFVVLALFGIIGHIWMLARYVGRRMLTQPTLTQ